MSIKEQTTVKEKYYNEAIRYMDNANEMLHKAGKEDRYYKDDKYVKAACGIAYSGVLKALDGYLILMDVEKKKGRKSIEYYHEQVGKRDRKLLKELNDAYEILHLNGYYDGNTNVKIISLGFEFAYHIIEKIKPQH